MNIHAETAPVTAPTKKPSLNVKVGSIVEVDRTHLPVALKLPPERRRFAAKVTSISLDEHEGWLYCVGFSTKANCTIAFAVPPIGETYEEHNGRRRGPKLRLIR